MSVPCCSKDAASRTAMVDFMFGSGVLTPSVAYRIVKHGGMQLIERN